MAQHAGPHHVRARIVVLRIHHDARRLGAHRLHKRQAQVVRHRHRAHVVEEALQQMAEHVGKARSCLERGQRERELRIHERELRTLGVVRVARFHLQCVVRHHRVLRRLAAGSRDGEHHGDGQHVVRQPLRLEEIPHVPVVVRAHGDGLRRVDDRAAAHGQHPVDIVFLAQRDAFASKRDLGVRTHAAQLHVLDALCIQRCLHAVDQAAFHGALAAEVQQHRTRTALGQLASHLLFSALSEHEVGRRHEFEVLHRRSFPPCVHVMLIVRGATYHIVLPAASPRKSILHRASSPAPRPGSS